LTVAFDGGDTFALGAEYLRVKSPSAEVQGHAPHRGGNALAQGNRLDIYRLLVHAGPDGMPAGQVAAALGLPPNTLSFHFDRLRNAGLVTSAGDLAIAPLDQAYPVARAAGSAAARSPAAGGLTPECHLSVKSIHRLRAREILCAPAKTGVGWPKPAEIGTHGDE
jgi:DNA-binding transcriptional ArsR family regulator